MKALNRNPYQLAGYSPKEDPMKKQPGQPMRSTILRLVSHGVALGTLAAILALLVPGRAEAIIIHMKFGQVGVVFDADQAVQVNVSDIWDPHITSNFSY